MLSNLSQHKGPQACSQCLQVVFDVMQCDEGIIFYHDVKEGQGTGGRVSLISLFPPVGFGGGGYGCCSWDQWKRSKTHCPKFTYGVSPEGFISGRYFCASWDGGGTIS